MQTRQIIDLEEFLAQLKEWQNRLSHIRIAVKGKSWVSRSITVLVTTLVVDGENGFAKRIDLNKAEVLERRERALFAEFEDGRTLELQEETLSDLESKSRSLF